MSDIEQPAGDEAQSGPGPGATEAARELAAAHMVDLEEIQGTGAGGKITRADVEERIAARATPLVVSDTDTDAEAETETDEVVAYEQPAGGHAPKVWTGPRR